MTGFVLHFTFNMDGAFCDSFVSSRIESLEDRLCQNVSSTVCHGASKLQSFSGTAAPIHPAITCAAEGLGLLSKIDAGRW